MKTDAIFKAVPQAEKKWADSMFMTNREKTILELLIKTGGRHTSLSVATYLQVSVRTIHRDLKKIEGTLNRFGLKLEQKEDNSLHIAGPDEAVFRLAQTIAHVRPLDLSVKERKLLLLLQLIRAREPMKTSVLAMDLGISVTTMLTDLDELSEWIADFDVDILRKRGVGIILSGRERAKRKALGSFFLFYFNEELIEAIFSLSDTDAPEEELILHYFRSGYLTVIDQVIKENISSMYAELADSDYVGFLVHVCIALQRHKDGFSLTPADGGGHAWRKNEEAHPFIEKICRVIGERLSVTLPEQEKYFLAEILKGSRLQNAESVYYDRAITGKDIKRLIQHVSRQMHVDLTEDFSLFQGLMAHLEPSLFRIRRNLSTANPLTRQIRQQFPALFAVTADSLRQVFTGIVFPDDEIAYVVLHFGSALEQRRQNVRLHALVVCPTGIGASRMLAMRLRKEMPELSSVTVASIGDMEKLDMDKFDLILSTVLLPKQRIPCIFVNPLLTRENIDEIHAVTRKLIDGGKAVPAAFSGSAVSEDGHRADVEDRHLESFMAELNRAQEGIKDILDSFTVIPITGATSEQQAVRIIADRAAVLQLTDRPEAVFRKLLAREKVAGLGIPDTNMALFHCRDRSIRKIAFLIGHADHHFVLRGMDGKQVDVSNFLILLAPETLDLMHQEVVSMISSSLVEDQESMLVFASANDRIIRAKLEDIFYRFLRKKFAKD